jgi:hypothetical protein
MRTNLLSHQRHAVESAMARNTSAASARFVDIRFYSYSPHKENMPWHKRMPIANNTQLERLTWLEKIFAIVVHGPALTLATEANPNDTMMSVISATRRALSTIPRMISCILGPIFARAGRSVGECS